MPASRHSAAWRRDDLQNSEEWRLEVPEAVAAEFAGYCHAHPGRAAAPEDFVWPAAGALPRMRFFAAQIRDRLLHGTGVTLIRGLAAARGRTGSPLTTAELRLFYVMLGHGLGTPMTAYGVLYPVMDRGVDYTTTALPVSMTNATTDFHTDSSAVDALPDFVGLLCETPSRDGGASLVASAARVHEVLAAENPDILRILQRPFVRDVVTPGVEKTRANLLRNRFPIFARDEEGRLLFRYMRYWIERGRERAGEPLEADERRALDVLDEQLRHPDHVLSFDLRRGDILWVNNRLLAHNRTAYRDTPGNVRKLQRMWVTVD